eukprot:SAG31_NODE_18973_length_616_cov_0.897485_1_plen_64_part_10
MSAAAAEFAVELDGAAATLALGAEGLLLRSAAGESSIAYADIFRIGDGRGRGTDSDSLAIDLED